MNLSVNSNLILSFHAPDVSDLTWNLVPKYSGPQGSLSGGLVLRNMCSPWQWLTMQVGRWKMAWVYSTALSRPKIKWGKEESLDTLEAWPWHFPNSEIQYLIRNFIRGPLGRDSYLGIKDSWTPRHNVSNGFCQESSAPDLGLRKCPRHHRCRGQEEPVPSLVGS